MDNRLRILQLFNRYLQYGGEEGAVYRIGEALKGAHNVENFLTSTESWMTQRGHNKLAMLADTFANFEVLRRLKTCQSDGRFDLWLIHNVLPVMSPLVYREAFRRNVPVVHYLHNYRLFCANGFFLNHGEPCMRCATGNFFPAVQTACWKDSRLSGGLMGAVLLEMRALGLFKRTTAWISISQRQKEIHAMWGIPEDKIEVIPHFLESNANPLPKALGKSLLFIGRLSAEKGVAQLIKAWHLLQAGNSYKLYIAGEGPERPSLEELARKLNLRNVVFTGFVDQNQQTRLWSECRASVVPSIWEEPFGMVVLEAWSRGRPVIANRIGALPELIENEADGLLADAFSPQSLASVMEQTLIADDATHQMGLRGFEKLKVHYSREVWLQKTDRLLRRIMGTHSA